VTVISKQAAGEPSSRAYGRPGLRVLAQASQLGHVHMSMLQQIQRGCSRPVGGI